MTKVFRAALLIGGLVLLTNSNAFAEGACDTDFNADGVTDEADFEILKSYLGVTDEYEGYTPIVDLNADGRVDMADVSMYLSCN